MKAQILKIAGVKSEKEFYKKYKTEADFMKVHGKEFKKAQTGAAIEKAQGGLIAPGVDPNEGIYNPSTQSGLQYHPYQPSQQSIINENQQITEDPLAGMSGKKSPGSGFSANMIPEMIDQASNIYNAFDSQYNQKQSLLQQKGLLKGFETLSQSTDVNEPYQKHVNDRPENYMASTNMFHPAQGTGYNILRATRDGGYIKAQSGETIGDEEYDNELINKYPTQGRTSEIVESTPTSSKFDSSSARDNWVQKTGLPWSEAKRLGYTSGSAKDNTKLLGELNDPRFKKENLRSSSPRGGSQSRTPIQHRETPSGRLTPIKPEAPTQSYADAMKGKPKYTGHQATVASNYRDQSQREQEAQLAQGEHDDQLFGERPLYYLANPGKAWGDFKSMLNPMTPEDETSEGFRKEVMANAYNTHQTKAQRHANARHMGYGLVPKAAANTAAALSSAPYTSYEALATGIGEGAGPRAAGYLGQGAKQIGQGALKQLGQGVPRALGQGIRPNFVMYQSGGPIEGNPTEIQNTYDPYDIYTHGGYQPMNDSDNIKSYQYGGAAGNAISGAASSLIGSGFNNNAGYQAGEFAGQFSDAIVPGSSMFVKPILGAIGGGLDQAFGDAGKISKLTQQNQGTQDRIMNNSMWKGMGQFGGSRQEGGYLNPEYNPQVITMFGDHNAEDFADYAHKYRSGGHLKDSSYTPVSESGLQTYADGGEVTSRNLGETQVESGGYLKPISYNPYNDGTGWTSEIEGQYHHDYDPKLGHSGVIFNHGDNQVEAEKGELIRHVQEGDSVDGGQGELAANITGNLELQPIFGDEDPKYKQYYGMKIKNIHKDIADNDRKLNVKQTKLDEQIANLKTNNVFSKLKQSSFDVMKKGIDKQYAANAEAADYITNHQTKVNDLVDNMSKLHSKEFSHEKFAKKGILSDVLAKGELSQVAKNGKTIKAQNGLVKGRGNKWDYTTQGYTGNPDWDNPYLYKTNWKPSVEQAWEDHPDEMLNSMENFKGDDADKMHTAANKFTKKEDKIAYYKKIAEDENPGVGHYAANSALKLVNTKAPVTTPTPTPTKPAATELEAIEETPKAGFPWAAAATSLLRGFQPAFNMPIGSQINPELYAMADNNVEGLNEPHMYSMLQTPYKHSEDPARNAILSQARQASKNAGNNPAAQAAIMAQVADHMGQLGSREADMNQQSYQGVYNNNINTVNQDRARNLGIDIDSGLKLAQAKSNTKAQKLAAMTSAEAKIAANKKENMEYNIGMAEHPDYTFGPDGRIIKLPRYIDFDTTGKGVATGGKGKGLASGKEFSYDAEGNIIGVHSSGKEDKARNGKSIKTKSANSNVVKAFKGF